MTTDFTLGILAQAMWIALLVCAPMMGAALIVGVAINVVQVVTQIQDSTLTFIPKLLVVAVCVLVFGSWMLRTIVQYTDHLWADIPKLFH